MVRKVKWTKRAQRERKDILQYWINRNKSSTYSKKLSQLFKEAINLLIIKPKIGRLTDIEDVRIKVVRDYLIFYEFDNECLYILAIWDSRQDPNKLKIKGTGR